MQEDYLSEQASSTTDAAESPVPESSNSGKDSLTEKKIQAIRASLMQRAEVEEETELAARIADHVRLAMQKKANQPDSNHLKNGRKKNIPCSPKARNNQTKQHKILGALFPKRGDSMGEKLRKCIFLLSSTVFVICLVLIGMYFYQLHQAKSLYEQVGNSYYAHLPAATDSKIAESLAADSSSEAEKVYHLLPSAQDLLAINSDVVGWLSIPDTQVDYPLMQRADDTPGDEYYLHRDLNQEYSYPGSIFLDSRCNFDRVGEDGTLDVATSDNLILYGHNMRDLSMFGSLQFYQTDSSYYDAHPLIQLNSNYEQYTYKIFAYYIADAEDTTDTQFDYWNSIQFQDETEFYSYVNEIKRRTLRITNVDVQYGDQLLTLSTCNSTFETARRVIVARRLRDGEDPEEGIAGSYANPNIKWPTVYYLTHDTAKYDPNAEFIPYGS